MHFDKYMHLYSPNDYQDITHFHHLRKSFTTSQLNPTSPVLKSGEGSWNSGLRGCLKIIKNQGCRLVSLDSLALGLGSSGAGLFVVVSD